MPVTDQVSSLNESTFFDQAENVDISDSHIVSVSGDYNDNHCTLNLTVNFNCELCSFILSTVYIDVAKC